MATQDSSAVAPIYHLPPDTNIVSIEHPCIVNNFDNGFRSLGGEAQIKHVIEHRVGDSAIKVDNKTHVYPEPVIGVSLRPHDPLAKKLVSGGVQTRNLLLRVAVPRRTGRKRKRGSNDPFVFSAGPDSLVSDSITAPELLARLRDNEKAYSVEPIGEINETHRFRGLPDFQVRGSELPIMREIRDHAMQPSYDNISKFHVSLNPGASHITAFPPPPAFVTLDQPYRYEYQQASGLVFQTDANGNPISKNISAPTRRVVQAVLPDAPEIPHAPPPDLPAQDSLVSHLQTAITRLKDILAQRPLATRRYLINALAIHGYSETLFKEATQYAGYSFRAGPFRDCLIQYGVDPRKDPKYRFYQTLMFQVDTEWSKGPGGQAHRSLRRAPPPSTIKASNGPMDNSHMFDGKTVSSTGKTWQICDITDPGLASLINSERIRIECDAAGWGWYHNGTMAKLRVIMKDKIRRLLNGNETLTEKEYDYIKKFPDVVRKRSELEETLLDEKVVGRSVVQMGLEFRAMVNRGAGPSYGKYGLEQDQEGPVEKEEDVDDEGGGDEDEEGGGDFEAMNEDEEDDGEGAEMGDASSVK
ncbi:Hypothetical protein R9X50_00120600 [Acrodontium crateriforme]|uniref:Transcription factor tau subunit sfc1 n=1 Tax=Acrodontium crateriforme TaxID=150365 RepID=A0AAQ3LZU8_9PEZI|nr:Hypothetical protein R9X50_00120600 [Acrodontium crateriforme]